MKKIIGHILIIALLTVSVGTAFAVPRTAQAACSIGGVATGNGLTDCVNELVVVVVMPIIGKFLQISAYLFDQALTINMNIAQFLQKPNCTGKDCATSPVEVIWRLIRDISGMFFIFILIWASIKMILSGENNKSVIVGVIMAGLLVNFSLFATKIVIDASNSLTLTIYRAIAPGQAGMTLYDSTLGGMSYNVYNYNSDIYGKDGTISSKIMQVVDLQSLFAATSQATKKTNFNVGSIVTVVGGISLMLVLGLAFLAAGLMFLWRFIMLLVLMAFSPIPALAYAFPQLRDKSNDFMKQLLNQSVFAPLFLFFIYIALRVLTNKAFISLAGAEHSTFANVFGGVGANIAPLVQYGLVIFIIFGGLLAAKSYGAKGADWGMKSLTGFSKWSLGFAGLHTVGRAAKTVAGSEAFKDFAEKNPNLAVLASGGLKKVGGATFGGTKGGYEGRVKNYVKARTELAKKLELPKEKVAAELEKIKILNEERKDGIRDQLAAKQAELKSLMRQEVQDGFVVDVEDTSPEGRKRAADLRAEIAKLNEDSSKLDIDGDSKEAKAAKAELEKGIKNSRTNKFAENLAGGTDFFTGKKNVGGGLNPFTRKANRETVEAISKELKKTKADKMLKELAKDLKEDGDDKEEKGDDKKSKGENA